MKAAIALGSSLGDRRRTLELVLRRLDADPDLTLERVSRWYRTPPLRGGTARNWFLNGVATFRTTLEPHQLLERCVAVEERLGRRRCTHWGDRTVDLDLLLVDDRISDDPALVLPHPAIARRPFVLVPLLEVWPDARDPRTGRRFADLRQDARPRVARAGMVAWHPLAAYV